MRPSRAFCWALVGFSSSLFSLAAVARSPQNTPAAPLDKKQLEAKAKELLSEGKALEKQGKLDEARDKYIDAEGFLSTKDALSGVDRIRDAKQKQAESLMAAAHKDCDAGRFADCAAKLEKALAAGLDKRLALHYDLALCYQKMGARDKAVAHLASVIAATQDKDDRRDFLQLRAAILLGGKIPAMASADLKKKIDGFNQAYVQHDTDPADPTGAKTGPAAGTLCDQIVQLQADSGSTSNAGVLFDAAKCAEEEGRDADAARLLGEYLKLAPEALDASDVQLHQESVQSLAGLEGDAGTQVRSRFAAAARDLDFRRYDRAIAEYRAAEQVAPSFALTQWRLALLYEASGDMTQARDCFQRYVQLETRQDRKAEAQQHLASLDDWRSYYDDNVEQAHDLIGDLLLRSMGLSSEGVKHRAKLNKQQKKISSKYQRALAASEELSTPFVRRQLERARVHLDDAIQLFPIAPEANEMGALLDLENNDWPAAFRSFDAVAAAGQPASFYAQMDSSKDNKVVLATKVEIGRDSVRLVSLSSYNSKKRVTEPPNSPAGEDDLGNLVTSAAVPPDVQADALTIPIADLEGVQTDKSFVRIQLHKQQIVLAPVYMLALTPVQGRTARQFGNEYTRMFVRYLGFEKARLGSEGMTFGEKLKLGYTFASTGMSFFDAVSSGGIQSYEALQGSLKLAGALRTNLSNLRRNMADQRRALDGLEFKPIPNQPVELAYRDHL
jgi:tetratricopeptide (TPR) repeat protein